MMEYFNLKALNDAISQNKTYEEIADEVVLGKWGYGMEQIDLLTNAGIDYHTIQNIVNHRLMNARKNGSNTVKKIIFNQKACIVFWEDGTKTVVKRKANDKFDKYAAVAQAIAKHQYGSTSAFHKMVDKLATFQPMTKLGD